MSFIQDGTGTGYRAKVDDDNMLMTNASMEPRVAHISHEDGQAYVVNVTDAGPGAGEYPIYLKNTSTTKSLVIDCIYTSAEDADVKWILHHVTGTAAGASVLTPVNINLASGNSADATSRGGAGGVTSLTSANVLARWYGGSAYLPTQMRFCKALVLGANDAIALEYDAGTGGDADITILFHYHD